MDQELFTPADILLPKAGTDMTKWSSLACDQFSSRPSYWEEMDQYVGRSPSSLRLMLPEAFLHAPDIAARKENLWHTMEEYLAQDVFEQVDNSFVYVERTLSNGEIRCGLVGKLDLECYDWRSSTQAPVRATEATVAQRLPARTALRRQAPLEMPHIVLFMDDPRGQVMAAASQAKDLLYDFDLYKGAGHIRGFRVDGPTALTVEQSLRQLPGPIVFAIGDGNHSLAAAKEHWQELKAAGAAMDHPARYVLAEVENLWDPAVAFFPIHRVVFSTDAGSFIHILSGRDTGTLVDEADKAAEKYTAEHGGYVDYIHDEEEARSLAAQPGNGAWILPALNKTELFPHIAQRGTYPKKSFSVGHSLDKRWYVECRKIVPASA